jgi:Tol biopolymer transport system component
MQTRVVSLLAVFGCLLSCHLGVGTAATTALISVALDGWRGNSDSLVPSLSADGRYVAFFSYASDLVPGDTNNCSDVFVRDRAIGETTRVSVASDGSEGNDESSVAAISADGRYVAFESYASNLAPGDTNASMDVFRHDRQTGETIRVSVATDGGESEGLCGYPSVSGDGRFISFFSEATNLIESDTNNLPDVFVHDCDLGATIRVSVSSDGTEADGASFDAAISNDGRWVAFSSEAANLVGGDANGCCDVFLHDRATGETTRVSVATDGRDPNAESYDCAIDGDGRHVAFRSAATNLVAGDTGATEKIFIRDREAGATLLASMGLYGDMPDSWSMGPCLSADGNWVAFFSAATNLVPGDTNEAWDVFVRDLSRERTIRVSLSAAGDQVDSFSSYPSISADGRIIAFESFGSGLVPGYTKGYSDIFLRDRLTFPDVPLDDWAFYEVEACDTANIVQGYPDGLYRPGLTITRDQMAVYISRGLAGGEDHVPTGPAQATFPDVPTDYWAYDHIEYTVANNVVQGYEDGDYHPDWEVTRGQMAVFVARSVVTPTGEAGLSAYEPPEVASFADVPTTYWCYKHVEYCKGSGIVAGYPDGTYKPTQYVTRDQMAVYIQRAFQLPL